MAKRKKSRKHLESFYQEVVRGHISKKYHCVALRELHLGGPAFDVVGFNPEEEEFFVIECKRTTRAVGVGQTFGQILAYKAMIYEAGEKFLDSFEKKLIKSRITKIKFWKHGAHFVDNGSIPVRFYVALREDACKQPEMLRLIKKDLSGVGIIRINSKNQCKDYIRTYPGKDYDLCRSERVSVPIAMPMRQDLKAVLIHKKTNRAVSLVAAKLDSKILELKKKKVKSVKRGQHALYYRMKRNFVGLHPGRNQLNLKIREKNGWKSINIREDKFGDIMPQIRKSLNYSLQR